ncbi:hypothetical protein C1646_766911 [Rhizophagus diaphanus]|nr:hypothetical protein C1646_766911 [Rhizophagus diaphanus] [Rhizophagus sp. MUCL 43196]
MSSTQHMSDRRLQQQKQKGYLVGGEVDKEDIHPETNELTFEKGELQKDQDNIEEVIESLTNEESINVFLARQRLRFVKEKLNNQKTKNSMFLEMHIAAHNIDGIASVLTFYLDAELFTHEKWNKNKSKSDPISKSRIDQIWITHEPDVIPVEFSVHLSQMVTNSHYSIISTTIDISGFIRNNFWHYVPDQLQDPDLGDKKICKDQDFLIVKDAYWIDYWLNRFNKYNNDYRRKKYDKFINKYEKLIISIHDLFSDIWINNVKGVVKQRIKIDKNYLQAQRLSKIQENIKKRCNIIHSDIPKWLLSTQDVAKKHIIIDQAVISNKNKSIRLAIDPDTIRVLAKNTFTGILRKRNTKSIEQRMAANTQTGKHELNTRVIPDQWKQLLIHPILKLQKFDYILANTLPIALLDNIRKSVTKLLTNRLSTVLTNNKVLHRLNFCGLKGEDTAIPLRLMNDIIENARENGRELWVVIQDMMKAYDSVSLESLQLALLY